jgi:AmpD protein
MSRSEFDARDFDLAGWLVRAHRIGSPNQDARPEGASITLLVIHNISLPPGEFGGNGVVDLFLNRLDHAAHPYYQTLHGLEVSSHFFIRRDGELIQFVPCERRAWHAGVSRWCGRERCNDFSIGVELEGTDDSGFTDAQYAELARLTGEIQLRYPIEDITGHSDIAPERKTDPGPMFDWARYRALIADVKGEEQRVEGKRSNPHFDGKA